MVGMITIHTMDLKKKLSKKSAHRVIYMSPSTCTIRDWSLITGRRRLQNGRGGGT